MAVKNTFVTIIGDQPAPNIFLIKDKVFQNIDQYIFISTDLMESKNRLQHLLAALAIPTTRYEVLKISPNNLSAIYASLDALGLDKRRGEYHVNVTSGSKIMAIGVFNYFMQKNLIRRCKFYYLSVRDRHFLQIFPEEEFRAFTLSHLINLEEYLTSYGIKVNQNKGTFEPQYTRELATALFTYYRQETRDLNLKQEFKHLIGDLRNQVKKIERRQRGKGVVEINIADDPKWRIITSQLQFPCRRPGVLDKYELQYLIGGWFEEWTYYQIKEVLQLQASVIGCSIELRRLGVENNLGKNEFDLLFIYKNELYVIECKSGLAKGYPAAKRMFDQAAHRLAALRSDFGLKVNTTFLTLSKDLRKNLNALKPAVENKVLALNIQVLDHQDFTGSPDTWIWKIIKP